MKFSICMIVKNEEANLHRALQSIPHDCEVIIVDTGSTDRTIEIASSFGAVIAEFQWIDDFAAARNYSVSLAMGDYILVMDADEQLPGNTMTLLESYVKERPESAGTVFIDNIVQGEITRHRMVRMFPNDQRFYFKGMVHEEVWCNGKKAPFEDTGLVITHFGYVVEEYIAKKKEERYLQLYEKQLLDNPNDGYMNYQMGKLLFSMQRYHAAEQFLYKSAEQNEEFKLYYPPMLVMLGYALEAQGRSKEAERLLQPCLNQFPDYPDLPFLLGVLAMNTGNIQHIEFYFLQAMQIGETNKYSSVRGVGSFKAAFNLGIYYELIGSSEYAADYYQYAANQHFIPAQERLLHLNKTLQK